MKAAVAALPAATSLAVPSVVDPSLKVTVPVGMPDPGATTATVAVSVTGWPDVTDEAEPIRVAAVESFPTVTPRAVDVSA